MHIFVQFLHTQNVSYHIVLEYASTKDLGTLVIEVQPVRRVFILKQSFVVPNGSFHLWVGHVALP